MRTLKQIIGRFMRMTAFILVCVILITTACIQINLEKSRAYESGIRTLSQIEQLLTENEKELAEITETYKETCLHNAEVIDRIIDRHPEILNDVDELREIAKMVEVDEIHFFTPEGCIYAGTHPEYYVIPASRCIFSSRFWTIKAFSLYRILRPIQPRASSCNIPRFGARAGN